MRRRLAVLTLCALVAFPVPAAVAQPDDDGGSADDNSAVAINTEDGSSLFRFAFSVRRVTDGTVDQTNLALAYASCEACQTVAIAIQVVLVFGGADVVTPTNQAVAVNEECPSCETAALATQLVIGVDDDERLSGQARGELGRLRSRFQRLRAEDLSIEELVAEVGELTDELAEILADGFVERPGRRDAEQSGDEEQEADDTTTTTTTDPDSSSSTTSTTSPTTTTTTTTSTTTAPSTTTTTTTP